VEANPTTAMILDCVPSRGGRFTHSRLLTNKARKVEEARGMKRHFSFLPGLGSTKWLKTIRSKIGGRVW
jgi:hypothetical protein